MIIIEHMLKAEELYIIQEKFCLLVDEFEELAKISFNIKEEKVIYLLDTHIDKLIAKIKELNNSLSDKMEDFLKHEQHEFNFYSRKISGDLFELDELPSLTNNENKRAGQLKYEIGLFSYYSQKMDEVIQNIGGKYQISANKFIKLLNG